MKMYERLAFALFALAFVTFVAAPSESVFAASSPQAKGPNTTLSAFEATRPHRGSLDPAFGNAGKVVTMDNDTGQCFVKAALQPDGKIVAVDCVSRGWLLVRYLADGSLDPTFGKSGIDVTSFAGPPAAVTVQTDGKILVVGNVSRPKVVRFNSNGTLDGTFGKGGTAAVTFPGEFTTIVVQSDGRIVMGADESGSMRPSKIGLLRFLSNGKLDSSFGKAGIALIDGSGMVAALAVVEDGSFDALISTPLYAVQPAHFSSSGRLITSPPRGKLAVIESTSYFTFQPDGMIVLGQSGAFEGGNQNARFTKFDWVDPTFRTPVYNFGQGNFVNVVTVEPNGGILTAGQGNVEFALGRFNPNGSLDSDFGTRGIAHTTFFTGPGTGASIQALLAQPDGKIVAVGNWFNNAAATMGIALARYLGP